MKVRLFTLVVFLAALILPAPAFADDVVVIVKGMVCSFCAQGLKKTFQKKPDVKGIDVDLENKTVKIHFAEGKSLPDAEIEEAIKDAGYDVLRIEHSVGGTNG